MVLKVADPLDMVMRYHQETKHHFSRYARSLGYLDWANQPDPFRRYEGAPLIALPLLKPDDAPASPLYEDLYRPGAIASAPVSVRSLSRLFEYSLAISAWKQAGEVRWALRTNPSSGNLHPTEAYLLIDEVAGFRHPGLYHYAAKEHALELRAQWPKESFASLLQGFPPSAFLVGFASVNWRETWKYGERAFRYCQHDVGHAIGSAGLRPRRSAGACCCWTASPMTRLPPCWASIEPRTSRGQSASILIASPSSGPPIKLVLPRAGQSLASVPRR